MARVKPILMISLTALLVLGLSSWGCGDDPPGDAATRTGSTGGGSGDGGGGSGGGVPLGKPIINSLGATSTAPASRLTVIGTGFTPTADVFIVFTGPDAYEVSLPVISASETELEVIVPPFFDLASGSFAQGVVALTVVQSSAGNSVESEPSDELTIEDLPETTVTAGELTAAFFHRLSETMELLRKRLELLDQFSGGSLAAARLAGNAAELRDAFNTIAEDVDAVVAAPTTSFTIGDADGEPMVVDATALELSDRLIGAAVLQRMGASGGSVDAGALAHVATQGSAAWQGCTPADQESGAWASSLGDLARETGGYMGYASAVLGVAALIAGAPATATVGITVAIFMATSYAPAAIGLALDYATGASLTGHTDYATVAPSVNYMLGKYLGLATSKVKSAILDTFNSSGATRVAADQALGAGFGAVQGELADLLAGLQEKSANGEPLLCQPTLEFCEAYVSFAKCNFRPLVTCGDGECIPCCENDYFCAPYSCECGPLGSWGPC